MTTYHVIDIDGRRYLWRDILELRRRQKQVQAEGEQLALFPMKHDCRPQADRTAGERYRQPTLSTL